MTKLLMLPLAFISILAFAGPIEDDIIARIHKVGEVCLQGDVCASTQATSVASTGSIAPDAIYERSCATCHDLGIAGAPAFANSEQWGPRLEKGMDVLYASGINGLAPGMPARGLCFDCSDEDIRAVVDYMVASVQ